MEVMELSSPPQERRPRQSGSEHAPGAVTTPSTSRAASPSAGMGPGHLAMLSAAIRVPSTGPSSSVYQPVLLCVGAVEKEVSLKGDLTMRGLLLAYFKNFHGPTLAHVASMDSEDIIPYTKGCFLLTDPLHGVDHEDFDPAELPPGARIVVKAEHLYARLVGQGLFGGQADGGRWRDLRSQSPANGMLEMLEDLAEVGDGAPDTFKSRLWALLDDPTSSPQAAYLACFVLLLILYSTVTFCAETLNAFYTPDQASDSFWYVSEAICIAIFTIEVCLRMYSCPDFAEFMLETSNQIDIVAICPFYIELALQGMEVPGLAVFRVVRLVRVFRMLKMSKPSITLFYQTMKHSMKPLYMLIMLTSIACIVMSSLIYYCERGEYNETLEVWERVFYWSCNTTVVSETPMPVGYEFPKPKLAAPYGPCTVVEFSDDRLTGIFDCPYRFKNGKQCTKVMEQTPFDSIPVCFWWTLVTMTTVGFGDVGPTSWAGKFMGILTQLLGIIVLALPITVIGSNFSAIYAHKLREQAEAERVRVLASEKLARMNENMRRGSDGGDVAVHPSQS